MTNYNDRLGELREARRKAKRRDTALSVLGVVAAVVIIVLGIAGVLALGAVITKFAWNYGVVKLVAASGGSVAKIGFLTALAVNFAIGIIGRVFRPTSEPSKPAA